MSFLTTLFGDLNGARKQAIKLIKALIPEIKKAAAAADGVLPTIEADLNDPIIKGIATELPDGTAVLAAVTGLLNKFGPWIAKIDDSDVLNALEAHLVAHVTKVFSGTEKAISHIIADVERDLGI